MDLSKERESLIREWIPYARKLSSVFYRRVRHYVELDDLESAAYEGLIRAVDSFDPQRSSSFKTFCGQKINWTMRDLVRDNGRLPRVYQQQIRRGELPSVCWQGLPEQRNDLGEAEVTLPDPAALAPWRRQQIRDLCAVALKVLRPRNRLVVLLYYYEEMTHTEIAQVLSCSESLVSKLMKESHATMYRHLRFRQWEVSS